MSAAGRSRLVARMRAIDERRATTIAARRAAEARSAADAAGRAAMMRAAAAPCVGSLAPAELAVRLALGDRLGVAQRMLDDRHGRARHAAEVARKDHDRAVAARQRADDAHAAALSLEEEAAAARMLARLPHRPRRAPC